MVCRYRRNACDFVGSMTSPGTNAPVTIPITYVDNGRVLQSTPITIPATGQISNFSLTIGGTSTSIGSLVTTPLDPNPLQSYTATAGLFCLQPGVIITVEGTDGYFGTAQCPSSGNSSCSVNVPGGAQSVQDLITVFVGNSPLRQAVIVF